MLARLQQAIVISLLALCAAWLWWSRTLPWPVAGVGLLVLLLGHAAFLAGEFLLAHHINRGDAAPRASASMVLRAWAAESVAASRVFLWQQPLRSHKWSDRLNLPAAGAPRRGIVFIHGFVCNRGLWNPWIARMHAQGRAFAAVNLEPVFGSIDEYAPIIDAAVRRVTAATGLPPVLVCHSMGGLAARAWLRHCRDDMRAAHVVTIGTPHHGTWLARFSHLRNSRQMQIGSAWLAQLQRDEPSARAARFSCFYSNCDNIVVPASSATLAGANNRFIAGLAHVEMAFDADVTRQVMALVARV